MAETQHNEIKPRHLARLAMIYVRQSTKQQVLQNTGSSEYQRGQAELALKLGWIPTSIVMVDEDLGLSGAAADHRPGYQRMLAAIGRDEVGAIFMSDLTRGGRDAIEWFRLLGLCRLHDTLFVVDGRVHDPNNSGELLITRLLATVGEHENLMRRENMNRGRIAKARSGHTISHPPIGYIRRKDGSWIVDPDRSVQAAIAALFREFLKHRTIKRTIDSLNALGVKIPARQGKRILKRKEPELSRIYTLLTNPAFKGEYVVGRRKVDSRLGRDSRGHCRSRKALPEEIIRIENHHEAYVDPSVWADIQTILKLNGASEKRRNPGHGGAMLQGIVRCSTHSNHSMCSVYKPARRDGTSTYGYRCDGNYHVGGPQCGLIQGPPLDRAVIDHALDRLSPPRLEAARSELKTAMSGDRAEAARRSIELNRARQSAGDMENRYFDVDPTNQLVKQALETRWEEAKREVIRLEGLVENGAPKPSISEEMIDELVVLCRGLRALFDAPTTTHIERKQLLRLLIEAVHLEERAKDHIRCRIVWADGNADTVLVLPTFTAAREITKRLHAEGRSPEDIAQELNALGLRTIRGMPWTATPIIRRLRRWRRASKR